MCSSVVGLSWAFLGISLFVHHLSGTFWFPGPLLYGLLVRKRWLQSATLLCTSYNCHCSWGQAVGQQRVKKQRRFPPTSWVPSSSDQRGGFSYWRTLGSCVTSVPYLWLPLLPWDSLVAGTWEIGEWKREKKRKKPWEIRPHSLWAWGDLFPTLSSRSRGLCLALSLSMSQCPPLDFLSVPWGKLEEKWGTHHQCGGTLNSGLP